MRRCVSWTVIVSFALGCGTALGQNAPPANGAGNRSAAERLRDATRNSPLFWDVSQVIDGYVKTMARYYNLTEKQEQYTRELMNQRVKQFLKDYEKDVRTLFGEYYEYQLRQQKPTPEAAKDFARRAAPLMEAIRGEIMDGNMQWRRILNEEQLKKHDRDLDLMKQTFDRVEDTFKRWGEGDVRDSDVGIRESTGPRGVMRGEDAMEHYVRNFIAMYNLDDGQKQTAASILREIREEAARYREANKDRLSSIDARFKELAATNPKDDPEEQKRIKEEGRKLDRERIELEKPINEELFNRLKKRLEDIPTADQRNAYKARMDALRARLEKRRAAMSQPATTRPAESTTAAAP